MKLYLCEKPSQGRDIAAVVGATTKGDGCYKGNNVVVTWAVGHLIQMANPDGYDEKYKKWNYADLPIVPDKWRYVVPKSNAKQLKVVIALIKESSEIIISTDADREGECIARELMDRAKYDGSIKRLWLSALDEKSIKKALVNLLPNEKTIHLYKAALGRARADWLVGLNLTRAYTTLSNSDNVLSVGRVQTPTLNIIVNRDLQIENFKSKEFFVLKAKFSKSETDFFATFKPPKDLMNDESLITDKSIIEAIREKIINQDGQVTVYKTERKKQTAPLPFDLSELQKELSKRYGIGAKETLDIAQSLYETHKATTYPRTDCQYLPESQLLEVKQVVSTLNQADCGFAALIENADLTIKSKVWNDKKISAHHAIIPTMKKTNIAKMSKNEKLAYALIVTRYLLQFYPDCEYDLTTIEIVVNDYLFSVSGKTPQIQGWKINEKDSSDEKEESQVLPVLEEGQNTTCLDAVTQTKNTTPPERYTEGALIQAMKTVGKNITDPSLKKILKETSGIGTEATRANIIETLFKRNYIEKEGKKNIVSTSLGRELIEALPAELSNPELTAVWEQKLEDVAKGILPLSAFLSEQKLKVTELVTEAEKNQVKVKEENTNPCPSCGKPLRRRKGSNGFFWGCSGYPDCKITMQDKKGKPVDKEQTAVKANGETKKCPDCSKDMIKRKGKFGLFWGCSGFPDCKKIVKVEKSVSA